MKLKTLFCLAIITVVATIALVACTSRSADKSVEREVASQDQETANVINDKDEVTFLRSFLDNYLKLNGKEAQDLAREHLTQDFYSDYIEKCTNQDNAIDVIFETAPGDKVAKIDSIGKGFEEPNSYIVYVQVMGADKKAYSMQYDMDVVKEEGKYKLNDSEMND